MSNQWLRLWHDLPNDPKWRTISKVSGQRIGDVVAVYIHILVCASNATERGRTQSFNHEDVASALDLEPDQVTAILDAMQGRVLDGDVVKGWNKRQVAREDGSAERAKAWREAKKAKEPTDPNDSERTRTQGERKRPLDTDTDTEKKKKKPARERAPAFDATAIELPDWIDRSDWLSWDAHRKEIGHPLTPKATEQQITDLGALRMKGHTPKDVIAHAIRVGWRGLFEPKTKTGGTTNGSAAPRLSIAERNAQCEQLISDQWP